MYGHESKPSRIYAYEARSVVLGGDLVAAQLQMAQKYRNDYIAIERARREAVAAVMAEFAPDIPRLEGVRDAAVDHVKDLESALKARSREARSRVRPTADERRALSRARGLRAEANVALKGAKAEFWANPAVRPLLKDSDDACEAARKALYNARAEDDDLHWGTKLFIERSFGNIRRGPPPEFRRWRGGKLARQLAEALEIEFAAALEKLPASERFPGGAVTVQIQNGLSWDDAIGGGDNRLRLEPVPGTRRMIAWVRVGSAPGGRKPPIWAKAEFHLHRTPPADAMVKWVHLHRGRTNRELRWRVLFEMAREAGWDRPDNAPSGAGRVGIDINWRSLPGGLRVATAVGPDNVPASLWIPRGWIAMWTGADALQSIRRRNFDAIRSVLAGWIATHEAGLPTWFLAMAGGMPLWKSLMRLSVLAWIWKDHRFPGDDAIVPGLESWRRDHPRLTRELGVGPLPLYRELEAWRRQDKHLGNTRDGLTAKAIRKRDLLYRRWVAGLRRIYGTAAIEDTDWKAIEARQPPDKDDPIAPRIYKRIAAPGRLAQIIREAMSETVDHPAENTTRRCHACGTIDDFTGARSHIHTCSNCCATWDIDESAARNLRDGLPAPGQHAGDAA